MIYRAFLSIVFFLFLSFAAFPSASSDETTPESTNPCDLNRTSCTQSLVGCQVTFDINPKPIQAMKNLTFLVIVSGKKPEAEPFIDLGMSGMKMGPNRVILRLVKGATYQGEGMVVKCPSGKKTWQAIVTIPSLGIVEFIFDVLD
jgi:hypothetical protein